MTVPDDFYVERDSCAWCRQPTVRVGLGSVDATRMGGKEPVVCGSCLANAKDSIKKSIADDQEHDERFRRMLGGG